MSYDYLSLASNAEDLDVLRDYIEAGKVSPVIGSRTPLQNIGEIREVCMQVYKGKGGLGKAVFEVIPEAEQ